MHEVARHDRSVVQSEALPPFDLVIAFTADRPRLLRRQLLQLVRLVGLLLPVARGGRLAKTLRKRRVLLRMPKSLCRRCVSMPLRALAAARGRILRELLPV